MKQCSMKKDHGLRHQHTKAAGSGRMAGEPGKMAIRVMRILLAVALVGMLSACRQGTPDGLSPTKNPTQQETEEQMDFYITEITDAIFARMEGKSYKADCTVAREELRYVHVLHKDFAGKTCEGELVVNHFIAKDVLAIFKELYENDYPIEKIRLVDEYGADDEASMADNNSSAFNYRTISYTDIISKHGLGFAIDINPLYNPYVKEVEGRLNVEPANAGAYVDRERDFAHKITHEDLACKVFLAHGFIWGGDWEDAVDYQHFEIPSNIIKHMYPDYEG